MVRSGAVAQGCVVPSGRLTHVSGGSAPSWPLPSLPQQNATAAGGGVAPQVWKTPTLIAAKLSPPETCTGVERSIVERSPSSPRSLCPQQYAALSAAVAHECANPAATATKL